MAFMGRIETDGNGLQLHVHVCRHTCTCIIISLSLSVCFSLSLSLSLSLSRGKCEVKEFVDIKNLSEYITNNDHFFYQHGYKPESRYAKLQLSQYFVSKQY